MIYNSDFTLIKNNPYLLTKIDGKYYYHLEGEQNNLINESEITNAYSQTIFVTYAGYKFHLISFDGNDKITFYTDNHELAKKFGFQMTGPFEYYKSCFMNEIESIFLERKTSSFPFPYPEGLPEREVIYISKE